MQSAVRGTLVRKQVAISASEIVWVSRQQMKSDGPGFYPWVIWVPDNRPDGPVAVRVRLGGRAPATPRGSTGLTREQCCTGLVVLFRDNSKNPVQEWYCLMSDTP